MNKAQALPEETCSLVKKADMYQTVSLPALDSDGEMHRALPAHRGGARATSPGRAGQASCRRHSLCWKRLASWYCMPGDRVSKGMEIRNREG